jgi:hypothetical protein
MDFFYTLQNFRCLKFNAIFISIFCTWQLSKFLTYKLPWILNMPLQKNIINSCTLHTDNQSLLLDFHQRPPSCQARFTKLSPTLQATPLIRSLYHCKYCWKKYQYKLQQQIKNKPLFILKYQNLTEKNRNKYFSNQF